MVFDPVIEDHALWDSGDGSNRAEVIEFPAMDAGSIADSRRSSRETAGGGSPRRSRTVRSRVAAGGSG